jgi:hypothetical protein
MAGGNYCFKVKYKEGGRDSEGAYTGRLLTCVYHSQTAVLAECSYGSHSFGIILGHNVWSGVHAWQEMGRAQSEKT